MASSLEQIGPHDLVFCSALDNDHATESCSLPFRKLICQLKVSMKVLVKHNYCTLSRVASTVERKKNISKLTKTLRGRDLTSHFLTFICFVKSEAAAGVRGAARPFQTRHSASRSDRCSGKDTKTHLDFK